MGRAHLPAALCWKCDRGARLAARGGDCRPGADLSAGRSREVSQRKRRRNGIRTLNTERNMNLNTNREARTQNREPHVSRNALVRGYRRSRPKLLRVIL